VATVAALKHRGGSADATDDERRRRGVAPRVTNRFAPMSKFTLPLLSLVALTSCGGGSSSTGTVDGLQGPQQVSIVEASGAAATAILGAQPVAGSDYETDVTRFWVEDDSMQALDTVNMILASLQQTRYWERTNRGAYRALVAVEEDGGGGRGNNATAYEEWVVDSTRANNSAPQIVKVWIKQDETMGQDVPSIIYARLEVTREPSASEPLGQFELVFKNLPLSEAATSTNTAFEGYLRTVARSDSQSELEFHMSHGDVDGTPALNEYAMRDRVHVIGDPANDTGRAFTESLFKMNNGSVFTEGGEYQVEFNADYLARRDVTNSNTLAVLDRNDFTTRVYQYGVYDGTTEDRIEQQGGFPVQDAQGANGWAGFYGIWFPEGTTLTNGQTLVRRSFTDDSTTDYTLFVAAGKLEKRSRTAITLADIEDEVLEWFDPSAGEELRVMWDGTDFVKTASRSGSSWTPISPAQSIASSFSTGDWVSCWSQARGQVEWTWPASLNGGVAAYVWSTETITADSPEMANGDLTLNGYFNLLKSNITSNQANYASSETPYLPDATDVNTGNVQYVFEKATLLLKNGGNAVTLADGVTVTQGPGMFGFNCGPLFGSPLASFNDIASQSTTFQWYTGTNEWNQLRTLKDGNGNFVQFDAPIRMSYTHSEAGSPFNGRSFLLEWDGQHLGGIPHEEDNNGRYYPAFNIPSGATVTVGDVTYKIKQLEGEQKMVAVGSPATVYTAQGFDIDGTPITAPTAAGYEDPAIGERPNVTAAPLYVGGVAQR